MDRKIYSAEEFLAAVKEETIFLCFPYFSAEFYKSWNSDWEKYVLGEYDEALQPSELLAEFVLEEGDICSPCGKPWQVAIEDVAFDFFTVIFKEYYQSKRPSFTLFHHVIYCAMKDWGDAESTYSFWCSEKWQKMLRETYDVYGARCNTPEDWISLFGETGILFTYES